MLTPQEVSTHAFSKSVVGGYNMAAVDEFLDELTDDYTALYKENAVLKAKMKVLVEKVEEYRATEDSMRSTLLAAQRMADSIVKEAEEKRAEILSSAEAGAQEKIGKFRQELAEAEERLRQGQAEMARFINAGREACRKELQFLEQLPQTPVETAPEVQPEPASPVEEIEEKVMASFQQGTAPAQESAEPAPAEKPAAPEAAPQEESAPAPADDYPEGNPFEDSSLDATRRINLSELKFGRNYSGNAQDR